MTEQKLKVILMGKKHWSAKVLEYLLLKGHTVLAVVAKNPEEELDRNLGSLYESAERNGIPIHSFHTLNEKMIAGDYLDVDIVISYLFWRKVKEPILSVARLGAINFHPAPLPDYRGLGGYNAAIIDNRKEYAVTAHYMSEQIDEGALIKSKSFEIDQLNETAFSLEEKSQNEMFELFKETINYFSEGIEIKRNVEEFQEGGVYIDRDTFEKMKIITEDDSPESIHRKIRAFWFPPYEGAKVKIGDQYFTVVDSVILKEISNLLRKE